MTHTPNFDRLLASAGALRVPLAVSVELTGRCNLSCRHCYLPGSGDGDGLSTPRLLELLGELAGMGTLFLTFTGGEPLLRRDWLDLVLAARRLGFSLRLFTNATLVDGDAAARLAEVGVAAEVSFHHMDEAVFDRITGVQGSSRAARRGVTRLREAGVEVVLKVPVMAANADGVAGVGRFARSLGAHLQADPRILRRRDGGARPLRLRVGEEALVSFLAASEAAPLAVREEVRRDAAPCAAGIRSAAVTAAGDVLACLALPSPAGNLSTASFRSIWESSPDLQRLRHVRVGDLRVCGECARLAYCQRCPAQALADDGDLLGPSAAACTFARAVERTRGRGC